MYTARFGLPVFVTALIALASCEHHDRPAAPPVAGGPNQHWMHGERLKKVMGQIAGLKGSFPKGLPEDAESPAGMEARRAMIEVAAVAGALADTAQMIPASVESKTMSRIDRDGFTAEAARLRTQATALHNAAQANQIEPLQGMFDGINATCIACHSRYRDISGDLNTHKASTPSHLEPVTLLDVAAR